MFARFGMVVGLCGFLLAFMGATGAGCANGCDQNKVQAWKDCEASNWKGAPQVLVDVTSALYSAGWQAALTELVKTLGQEQLNCAVAAVRGEIQARLDSNIKKGQPIGTDADAVKHANAWLAKAPTDGGM